MDIRIHREHKSNLKRKAVTVIVKSETNYKLAEVVMPVDADSLSTAQAQVDALWAGGVSIESSMGFAMWIAARQRQYRDYFYAIHVALEGQRVSGGTLDSLISAGLTAIQADSSQASDFASWRTMMKLSEPQNDSEKRDLVALMVSWSTAGIIGGGIG